MHHRSFTVLALSLLAGLAGCHSEAPTPDPHGPRRGQSPEASAVAPAAEQYPMIVRIVGRHHAITVTAGPAGPLYSATTTDGRALVAGATLEQLRQDHPDLYRQLNPSIAVESDENHRPRQGGDATEGEAKPEPVSSRINAGRMPLLMSSVD